MPFQRKRDGVHVALATNERALLRDLAAQVVGLLDRRDGADPALLRLLPDAYPGDDEAAAEFRRLTADDLTEGKIANARVVLETLSHDRKTPLGPEAEQAWLRTLTDIRLTLGSRLGVTAEGFTGPTDDQGLMMRDVFDWLGYVQEALVRTLDR